MKTQAYFVMLWLLHAVAWAQPLTPQSFAPPFSYRISSDYQDDLDSRFAALDKSQIPTGALYYKNIPVEGVDFTLHSSIEGVLTLAHGKIPENLEADVSKSMPKSKAFDLALVSMKLSLGDFEKKEKNTKKGELLFPKLSEEAIASNFCLAYTFKIYGDETLNAFRVYGDANTGEILKKVSLIHSWFGHQHQLADAKQQSSNKYT